MDKNARVAFCRWFIGVLDANAVVLHKLIMSIEAHFHLSGYVDKQNCRYWSVEQTHNVFRKPLHSSKVTVWCGVSAFEIIGPHFFEVGNCRVTVTSAWYQTILEMLEVDADDIDGELWFQQDSTSAYTAHESMDCVTGMFSRHIISHFGDIAWPARFPDLSVPDYFFWVHLKAKVYTNTRRALKRSNSTSETKWEWPTKVCCKWLWLISNHGYRNALHARETNYEIFKKQRAYIEWHFIINIL